MFFEKESKHEGHTISINKVPSGKFEYIIDYGSLEAIDSQKLYSTADRALAVAIKTIDFTIELVRAADCEPANRFDRILEAIIYREK